MMYVGNESAPRLISRGDSSSLRRNFDIVSASSSRAASALFLSEPRPGPELGDGESFGDVESFSRSFKDDSTSSECPEPQYRPRSENMIRWFSTPSSNDPNAAFEM